MADGDVFVDTEHTFRDGTRSRSSPSRASRILVVSAIGFGTKIPALDVSSFDNSQVTTHGADHHHRYEWLEGNEAISEIELVALETHLSRFRAEVTARGRRTLPRNWPHRARQPTRRRSGSPSSQRTRCSMRPGRTASPVNLSGRSSASPTSTACPTGIHLYSRPRSRHLSGR